MNENSAVNRFDWEDAMLQAAINRDSKVITWAYSTYGSGRVEDIFPGIKDIAEKTGFSKDKVRKTRAALIENGWLTPSGRYTPSGTEKLFLTIGNAAPEGYLASGTKRVSPKSLANLKPGARYLSGRSRESDERTSLENRENGQGAGETTSNDLSGESRRTCLDIPEDFSGESRDETLEYQARTTKNNQLEQPARTTSEERDTFTRLEEESSISRDFVRGPGGPRVNSLENNENEESSLMEKQVFSLTEEGGVSPNEKTTIPRRSTLGAMALSENERTWARERRREVDKIMQRDPLLSREDAEAVLDEILDEW